MSEPLFITGTRAKVSGAGDRGLRNLDVRGGPHAMVLRAYQGQGARVQRETEKMGHETSPRKDTFCANSASLARNWEECLEGEILGHRLARGHSPSSRPPLPPLRRCAHFSTLPITRSSCCSKPATSTQSSSASLPHHKSISPTPFNDL